MSLDTFLWALVSVIAVLIVIGLTWWYGKKQREEEEDELRRLAPLPDDRVLSEEEVQYPFGRPMSTTRLQPATASVHRIQRQPAMERPTHGNGDDELAIDLGEAVDDTVNATVAGTKIIGAAVAGVAAAVATTGEIGGPAACQRPDATPEELSDAGDTDDERPQSEGPACAVAEDSGNVGNDPDPEPTNTPD